MTPRPRAVAWIPPLAIAALALAIAWAFAATVLGQTRPFGLPLDDSYVRLAQARQLARGELPGALWSIVLAPAWAIGVRGQALVWLAFAGSAALYAASALGAYRIAHRIAGTGLVAALGLLGLASFASSLLAASDAALTAAVLVALASDLLDAPPTGPPRLRLAIWLAAALLAGASAPIAIGVMSIAAIQRLRQRNIRAAAWWLAPLAAPGLWCLAHRGIALPLGTAPGGFVRAVLWDPASPLGWPRIFAVLWLIGAWRVVVWARAAQRRLAGAVVLVAPVLVLISAALGHGTADGGRWLAPASPFVMIGVACAFGQLGRTGKLAAVLGLAGYTWVAVPALVTEARRFAQAATDLAIAGRAGERIHARHPDARLAAERPGAIGYVADVPVTVLDAREGPGVLFEQLEGQPPEQRPAMFAIDPGGPAAPAIAELSGESLFRAMASPAAVPRLGPAPGVELFAARWDHTGTGERPRNEHAGWSIVDRVDLADRDSEAAHGWSGVLGVAAGDPPARWSVLVREVGAQGLILDGGRTIRGGERFTLALDASRPTRLVLRTGGPRAIPGHDPAGQAVDRPSQLRILDAADRELAAATIAVADGRFVEVTFALPAGSSPVLHVASSAPYRAFHWFALQPE